MTITAESASWNETVDADEVTRALSEVAKAASVRRGVPAALLEGYPQALLSVARTGRQLSAEEEATCRRRGGDAVAMGVGLPALVDAHMNASRRSWSRLPQLLGASRRRPVRSAELLGMGEAVWRAADAALAALTGGYVEAQRLVVRWEEASRREFVDDLLTGRSAVGPLIERAEPFGLQLAGSHVVVVVEADRVIDAGAGVLGRVEDAARVRFGDQGLLVAAKDGRLVAVLACTPDVAGDDDGARAEDLVEIIGPATARPGTGGSWRAGISRPHAGPRGVRRSHQEAVEALDTAARLDLPQQVVHAADLLVYRVLARDETALTDLVRTVLEPLAAARGGAVPLVETLDAYFSAGSNAAEAARRLHLSVRAVTYRLQRVEELTGYAAGDPADRLPLLVAVTGARLLDWPRRAMVSE
jgi:sugar diacid utilization regulator